MLIFGRGLCLYIIFDVSDPNFAVNFQTGPTTLPTRILKNGYKLVKNSQIKLKSCMLVDFDLGSYLLLFKCELNMFKVPKSGLIFDEKWQNWSKFSDLKFQGSDPIKETHLHQKQLICTFFEL